LAKCTAKNIKEVYGVESEGWGRYNF